MLKKLKGVPKEGIKNNNYRIIKEDIGKVRYLKNGLDYFSLVVSEGMEGYYFSEFFSTKSRGTNIHIKKQKKGKKK